MHRSASTTRALEEFHLGMVGMGTPTPGGAGLPEYSSHLLPKYDPQSDSAKKEAATRARSSSADSAIHLIPLVLIACAVVLWLFSSPHVDMTIKADFVAIAGMENATIQGYNNDTNMKLPHEADEKLAAAAEKTSSSITTGPEEEPGRTMLSNRSDT